MSTGVRVHGVDQEDVDGAGGGRGLEVGVDVGREPGLVAGRGMVGAELAEAADGLGMAIFGDGEVGLLEVADGVALGVGDDDVDDGFAGVDVEGWARCCRDWVRLEAVRRRTRLASWRMRLGGGCRQCEDGAGMSSACFRCFWLTIKVRYGKRQ